MTRMQVEYAKRQIENNLTIVDALEKYGVSLKQKGSDFFGLCPFHNEKTPSFIVHPNTNKFHCFGCNEDGDMIDFVQKFFKCNFIDALKRISIDFNIHIDEQFSNEEISNFRKQQIERDAQKKAKKEFDDFVKEITNKVCERNYVLYDIIQKNQPHNKNKLSIYAFTKHPEIVMKAQKQYDRNEMFLDAFSTLNVLSDREHFLYGYEDADSRLVKIVDMIKQGMIKINEKGDVLYG